MGRQFFLIAALLIVLSDLGLAQGRNGGRRGVGLARPNQFRSPGAGMHVAPEDRQVFRRNAERWLKMDAHQQEVLRDRERLRQQQIRGEVDTAIRQSGLHLDQNGRAEFETRYRQERRRLERELRQEFDSRRQQELPGLNERLKKEFQARPANSSPSNTASPGR